MTGARDLVAISSFILLNAVGAMAQEASPGQDARTQSIINDKTGKYAWVEDKEWYVAKTCHGRANRFVFARIGETLFRFRRNDVFDISAPWLLRLTLAEDKYRYYFL